MSARLEEIAQQLRDEEQRLNAEESDLRARLSTIEDELGRVQAAINELCPKPSKSSRSRKTGRGTTANRKPKKDAAIVAAASSSNSAGEPPHQGAVGPRGGLHEPTQSKSVLAAGLKEALMEELERAKSA